MCPLNGKLGDLSLYQGSGPDREKINLLRRTLLRIRRRLLLGNKMNTPRLVKCQKCGKPLGYVTVLGKGLTSLMQPLQNVKVVAICIDCSQKR
jgi:hypothetical protein